MERILRGEEISRLIGQICSYEKQIFYFPVRHHSVACAFHLTKVIQTFRPDCILVEGPENANEMIKDITDEQTQAPFCIYYSYRDKKGYLGEICEDYRCYYPFLDYSPELVAMREGKKLGADLFFMDLPYEEILIAQQEGSGLRRQEDKISYNNDHYLSENKFIEGVVSRSGAKSFDEFWEQHFEIEGLQKDSISFLQDVLYYCVLSRANTRKETMLEDGCLVREAYMRQKIGDACKKYRKVLVVAGGFHIPGLFGPNEWLLSGDGREHLGGDLFGEKIPEGLLVSEASPKTHAIDKLDKGVYLMAYSMAATDRLNGYCSGMPHPMFYQRIWERINTSGNEGLKADGEVMPAISHPKAPDAGELYGQTCLQFLVEVGRKVRKKEGYPSAYDEICAMAMCDNLASLRGKPFPGVYELCDSVLSNYVKGEYQISTDKPMRILQEELTGDRIGRLTENATLPPLCKDFEKLCQSYRLDIHNNIKKEMTLSLFAKRRHREISAFFYRMDFLGSGFAQRKKGPNLRKRKDRNLIREIWEYRFSPAVMSSLIENSMYGGNIEEVCRTLVEKRFSEEMNAAEASALLIQMFEMGCGMDDPAIIGMVFKIIQECEDFFSLTTTFSNLIMLIEMQDLYGYQSDLISVRNLVAQKLLTLLGHMTGIRKEDVDDMLDCLKELYRVFQEMDLQEERRFFISTLEKMSVASDLNPSLAGALCGLLYASGERTVEEVGECTQGYLCATGEKALNAAEFVRGLFFVARDILFVQESMLEMLDTFLLNTSSDAFVKLLPSMRLAFSFFTPIETDRIAGMVAKRFGLQKQEFRELNEVTPEEFEYGTELEKQILKSLGENV